jgi:hypothetical protein
MPASRLTARTTIAVALAAWLAAACTEQAASNGTPSRLNDKIDCQAQAKRQAELQYPRNSNIPPGAENATQWYVSESRDDAQYRLYLSCLRSKGLIKSE